MIVLNFALAGIFDIVDKLVPIILYFRLTARRKAFCVFIARVEGRTVVFVKLIVIQIRVMSSNRYSDQGGRGYQQRSFGGGRDSGLEIVFKK